VQIQGTYHELIHSDSEFAHLLNQTESDDEKELEAVENEEVPRTPSAKALRKGSAASTRSSRVSLIFSLIFISGLY